MYLLFDIGGTNIRLAVSPDGETLGTASTLATPADYAAGLSLIKEEAAKLMAGQTLVAVAGGIAGVLDKDRSTLVHSPHLPGWINKPLKADLAAAFSCPVWLANDSALGGLGEAVAGPGQGSRIVAYVSVGTGIGGARIVDGQIDDNTLGFEPGHQIVDATGALFPNFTGVGYWEDLISGTATEKRYGQKPHDITDPAIWDKYAQVLAYGLNNIVVLWSPEAIVLGGSMINRTPGIDVEATKKYLKNAVRIFSDLPRVERSTLGDQAGLVGALALLKQKKTG